jgi:hypothetical protein
VALVRIPPLQLPLPCSLLFHSRLLEQQVSSSVYGGVHTAAHSHYSHNMMSLCRVRAAGQESRSSHLVWLHEWTPQASRRARSAADGSRTARGSCARAALATSASHASTDNDGARSMQLHQLQLFLLSHCASGAQHLILVSLLSQRHRQRSLVASQLHNQQQQAESDTTRGATNTSCDCWMRHTHGAWRQKMQLLITDAGIAAQVCLRSTSSVYAAS